MTITAPAFARERLRLLVVNDDGIGAPGLDLLVAAARTMTDDVWTVAPAVERSGASHAIRSWRVAGTMSARRPAC